MAKRRPALLGAAMLVGIAALPATAQRGPHSPLHGVWHGTVGDYTGKTNPKMQIEVSPNTGCHWQAVSAGKPGKYERTGCNVSYQYNIVTLEIPRRWSLSLKLEGDSLVGIYVEGDSLAGTRYHVTMTRGPWTD